MYVFPASHYVAGPERMERAIGEHRGRAGGAAGRAGAAGQAARGPAAAHAHDLRHRDDAPGRLLLRHRELLAAHRRPRPGHRRRTRLLDYFPEDFLLVIDESHVTVPQIGGMYEGDMSRKRTLVDHGFRLPSAMDNRPLRWEEFLERIGPDRLPVGHARAATSWRGPTASSSRSSGPTGLVDPEIVVKPTKGQIDDLLDEIRHARRAETSASWSPR